MAECSSSTELTAGRDCILEPLSFPELGPSVSLAAAGGGHVVSCVLCEHAAPLADKDGLLRHLVLEHKLVIADVKLIADFPRYMLYWRKRFTEQPITHFCSVIKTNSEGPAEQQEHYFLLCDALPEDRVLREQLQQKRLGEVLDQQQKEREDTSFQRTCMFCSEEFSGNRSSLLNHMAREHAFSIGLPDNIVYSKDFLDTLERKLDNMQCLYCEKTFRDKITLKDHMRKKQHRRINGNNHEYDRFYVINYLELGKTWEEVQSEDDRELADTEDDDWSDWQARPVCAVCLFCEQQAETMEEMSTHMQEAHGFHLHKLKTDLNLRFYQQVKLVNFIRREIHQGRCYGCQEKFGTKAAVLGHLVDSGHVMKLPEVSSWDQPQYFFPTYENDALLTALSDSESDSEAGHNEGNMPVIAEDIASLRALGRTSVLNKLLKDRTG